MLKIIYHYKATFVLIVIWMIIFVLTKSLNIFNVLSGKGIENIRHDYFRFVTAPLLHFNMIHLVLNIASIFWVGYFIEQQIGSIKFLVFGLITSTLATLIFSCIYPTSEGIYGGSIFVFSFLGLIIVLQIFKMDFPRFHLGTWYGNWLVAYGVIGNIPILSFMSINTLKIHLCALFTGFILGSISIFLKIL